MWVRKRFSYFCSMRKRFVDLHMWPVFISKNCSLNLHHLTWCLHSSKDKHSSWWNERHEAANTRNRSTGQCQNSWWESFIIIHLVMMSLTSLVHISIVLFYKLPQYNYILAFSLGLQDNLLKKEEENSRIQEENKSNTTHTVCNIKLL